MRHYNKNVTIADDGTALDISGVPLHSYYRTNSQLEGYLNRNVDFVSFEIADVRFFARYHQNRIIFCSPFAHLHGQIIDCFDRFLNEEWIKSMILKGNFEATDGSFEYLEETEEHLTSSAPGTKK